MITSPFKKLFKRRDTCQFILSPPLQDGVSPSSSSQCTSISLDEIPPMVVFDEACEDSSEQYPNKYVDLINVKGKKLLWNVETHWISMFSLAKMVYMLNISL
jgi:hypothetical protein